MQIQIEKAGRDRARAVHVGTIGDLHGLLPLRVEQNGFSFFLSPKRAVDPFRGVDQLSGIGDSSLSGAILGIARLLFKSEINDGQRAHAHRCLLSVRL